jgi:hypothetical protein
MSQILSRCPLMVGGYVSYADARVKPLGGGEQIRSMYLGNKSIVT